MSEGSVEKAAFTVAGGLEDVLGVNSAIADALVRIAAAMERMATALEKAGAERK